MHKLLSPVILTPVPVNSSFNLDEDNQSDVKQKLSTVFEKDKSTYYW